ncbi:ATP-binding response regulator [Adhaeribacter rhizoryzae]|uniref:histidine kinase n=1 Tax=Adhaeribacter rhizoryzae TaxID=2607907 RepID=A0A5M6DKR7_9BACT|nr:ATP-binding protein [Adhaeribacter rhizoryzae]KAA5548111.1 response regulator [Adhaeribacter rhizoryzae]
MLVFGTEMHLVTFVFLVLEIAMFFFQFIYFLSRPQEKNRFWYLVLLFLLILYNVTGGLFPDKNLPLPIIAQNIMAYGSGFIMASYIPYYFYKAFNLQQLRFHALYGIYLFLILPFLVFFVVEYSINGNLDLARQHGIIIPFFYTIVLLLSILKATRAKYKSNPTKSNLTEVVIVCCAVIPWASMPIMAYFNASQLLEVSVCNGGFIIITIIFIRQSIHKSREEFRKLQELNTKLSEKVKERTQQLEALHEQRTHNFVNLVHETKTPLTLVNNYLDDFLHKHGSGEEMDIIKGGIHKLTKDITSLFDIEKFNKGVSIYNHHQISNFSTILNESLILFEPYCQKHNLNLIKNITEEVFIKADPNAINRIVYNLIENAIKFSYPGGMLEVTLKTIEDKIFFSVQDTGPGISTHFHKKIFEPYFQINRETTSLQGMGLGLPIVAKVTDSLGGQILIDSNPEREPGTKISIILQRHYSVPGHITAAPSETGAPTYYLEDFTINDTPYMANRQTILLVEDNKAMLNFLIKKLSLKYNIFCSLNGAQALKKLQDLPVIPDLILTDIMMDKMDGFNFAKALSEQKLFNHIPLIFLSAKSTSLDKIKGLRLGAIDMIQKPFSSEELIQKIDSVLQNIKKQKSAILQAAISNLKISLLPEENPINQNAPSVFEQNCKLYNLTDREIDIVKLIRQGSKYKTIAESLFISERTVNKHVQNIFEKVGVSNKVELLNKLDLNS